jgi:hypothetical protein
MCKGDKRDETGNIIEPGKWGVTSEVSAPQSKVKAITILNIENAGEIGKAKTVMKARGRPGHFPSSEVVAESQVVSKPEVVVKLQLGGGKVCKQLSHPDYQPVVHKNVPMSIENVHRIGKTRLLLEVRVVDKKRLAPSTMATC